MGKAKPYPDVPDGKVIVSRNGRGTDNRLHTEWCERARRLSNWRIVDPAVLHDGHPECNECCGGEYRNNV